MNDLHHASVLAVFAHPDDEIFHSGILAHLSERGARVTVACATAGEAGKVHPSLGPVKELAALRMEELRLACRRLGIEPPVFLGFHDSGRRERQRHDDPLALVNLDMLAVEARVRRVIQDVRPHVIFTFDPHGGYAHPDHIAIHRATTAAFFSSGVMGADAPARLFYGAMDRHVFRTFADRTRGRGILDGLDPDVFGIAAEMIALSFDAAPYVRRKLAALAAHRSQFGVTDAMLDDPPSGIAGMLDAFRPVFEREVFLLGGTRVAVPRWPMSDPFEGLDSAPLAPAHTLDPCATART
jgi:LmbE family N-acetylglucosaminyl deacetylase